MINQHSKGWCGACYLVCAVQCIDDRGYIASVRSAGGRKVARRTVSLQSVMDHYQVYQGSKEEDGWNGCHGGWSSEVFQCFVDKECPLAFEAGGGAFSWSGFVRSVRSMVSPTVGYQVVSHSVLPPNEVPHRLVAEGPVVLEISADVCLSLDERGVCTDLTPRSPDHAVCGGRVEGGGRGGNLLDLPQLVGKRESSREPARQLFHLRLASTATTATSPPSHGRECPPTQASSSSPLPTLLS